MSTQTVNVEELEKFTTGSRREILFYLHQLINDSEPISVVFSEGHESLLTVLLDIDASTGELIFDWGGSEETNAKLLASSTNFFVCAPHGIGNRFVTGPVRKVRYKNQPAFATKLPERYTRLQRREFFRLVLPLTQRPTCSIPRANGETLRLPVVDISIGGIAVELPAGQSLFEVGQIIPQISIELKKGVTIIVDLEIRNHCEIQRGNKSFGRIGGRFVELNHATENQLQRFITDVQRAERARLGT